MNDVGGGGVSEECAELENKRKDDEDKIKNVLLTFKE